MFTSEQQDKLRKFARPFSDAINSVRNSEDRSAWKSLGVRADYFDLPEALLRKRFPFSLFASGKDDKIIDQLCAAIRPVVTLYPDAAFYFPAGFGNHVDHLACRTAAFRLLDEGVLGKITLYEDIPYCWLSFIRKPSYKVLLRKVELNDAGFGRAIRPGGLTMWAYLKRKIVPFPRGRKLFVAVSASLFIERCRSKFFGGKPSYQGSISLIELTSDHIAQKKTLLFQYKSQIPLLFGADPMRLLDRYSKSLATEVAMEISRLPRTSGDEKSAQPHVA